MSYILKLILVYSKLVLAAENIFDGCGRYNLSLGQFKFKLLCSSCRHFSVEISKNPKAMSFKHISGAFTSMVDDEQLLSMCSHADHRPRQAEDLFLDSSYREQAKHQSAGGGGGPALAQTQRPHVLALGQIHHPLLIGVPRGEVETLQLTGRRSES